MKKILFLLAALAYAGLGSAQSIEADTLPTLPPHVYCEITAHHLPTHRNNGVLFDFGQKTEVLKYLNTYPKHFSCVPGTTSF